MIRDRQTRCKEKCAGKQRIPEGLSEVCLARGEGVQPARASAMMAKKRRMSDLQQQLEVLRQRIARIDKKWADQRYEDRAPAPPRPPRVHVEEWLSGGEVETSLGKHFETERLYERHRRHGSADVGSLADLPHDLLDT